MNAPPASSPSPPAASPIWLWFGVLATPFAWIGHELLSYMAASQVCSLRGASPAGAQVHALSASFVLIAVGTLALALAGTWVAVRNWRKMRRTPRGEKPTLSEVDPERQHFLAKCGLINSAVFLIAFLFTIADILVEPLCGT